MENNCLDTKDLIPSEHGHEKRAFDEPRVQAKLTGRIHESVLLRVGNKAAESHAKGFR